MSEEENQRLKELHQELLAFAKNKNNSMEEAYKLNSLFEEPIIISGTRTDLDLGILESKFVLHNHPNNESFSDIDIAYFLSKTRVKYISLVKHNGEVEIIEKTEFFDLRKAFVEFKRSEEKNKNKFAGNIQKRYNLIIKDFLKKSGKTGINYIRR